MTMEWGNVSCPSEQLRVFLFGLVDVHEGT